MIYNKLHGLVVSSKKGFPTLVKTAVLSQNVRINAGIFVNLGYGISMVKPWIKYE